MTGLIATPFLPPLPHLFFLFFCFCGFTPFAPISPQLYRGVTDKTVYIQSVHHEDLI